METKERKHDMHKLDRDILVSDMLKNKEEQEELNEWIDKQNKDKERTEDLDNQELSKGEDNET